LRDGCLVGKAARPDANPDCFDILFDSHARLSTICIAHILQEPSSPRYFVFSLQQQTHVRVSCPAGRLPTSQYLSLYILVLFLRMSNSMFCYGKRKLDWSHIQQRFLRSSARNATRLRSALRALCL
jgi:hypothetical protein